MNASPLHEKFGARHVYGTKPAASGATEIQLSDRAVELGSREYGIYAALADWLPTNLPLTELEKQVAMKEAQIARIADKLCEAGLLYRRNEIPKTLSGVEFHARFSNVLNSWLSEAFSHPFWERMMSGKGSRRLFCGWSIELYHYTRNANRHMPLSCAYAQEKAIKQMRAKHYAEEWNHYHYFMKSLKALGFTEAAISHSVPLPMTLALSNFMRQAAREDILAYSICSAVLEGTTVDRGNYNPYYEKTAELYSIPQEALQPIYAHLDLDVQYQHSDLFLDILSTVDQMTSERATRVLDYGHQLVEHIWLWTDGIEKYYGDEANQVPRRAFDPFLD